VEFEASLAAQVREWRRMKRNKKGQKKKRQGKSAIHFFLSCLLSIVLIGAPLYKSICMEKKKKELGWMRF